MFNRISISSTRDYFTREGKPFFYMADTVWMAFSRFNIPEWKEYINIRSRQGFNVLQISLLPIVHDQSTSEDSLSPFKKKKDNSLDFFSLDCQYFARAEEILSLAVEKGFTPCIHLLWANYVPDTWASQLTPHTVMPLEAVQALCLQAVRRFKRFKPLYSISGDTCFESDRVCQYYMNAFTIVKQEDPEALTTLHLSPQARYPGIFRDYQPLDFYSFQGGHVQEMQYINYTQTDHFLRMARKPVINTEPPYEGHGYAFRYGRFRRDDIRRAIWLSLLSGAKAGITYGAHGIWSSHREGDVFSNVKFSGTPFDWRTALTFTGVEDAVYAKELFLKKDLFTLHPSDLVLNSEPGISMMISSDSKRFIIYVPYSISINIGMSLEGYHVELLNPDIGTWEKYKVKSSEFMSEIPMYPFNNDALIYGEMMSG